MLFRSIRVGSAGAYSGELNVYDIVLADSVWSESSFARTQNGFIGDVILPDPELNQRIKDAAESLQIPLTPTKIHSSDVFYCESSMPDYKEIHDKLG